LLTASKLRSVGASGSNLTGLESDPHASEECLPTAVLSLSPDGSLAAIGVSCGRPSHSLTGPQVVIHDSATAQLVQTAPLSWATVFSWEGRTLVDGDTVWCR
jgi:hypothetical protein